MPERLAVWLYGLLVATIDQERGRPRLTYTEEALHQYPAGTPLLSLSLPLRVERFPQGVVRPFIDGLLPEGESRTTIARSVGVRTDDSYGLIRALGRDCAGAMVIQPADESSPLYPATATTAEPLSYVDLADLVVNLRSAPLGAGGRVRISLAGVQEKLLLTRLPDGSWGRPIDGTPSTHILKPEIAAYPNSVENEAFCMRMARHLGLEVANVETVEVAGRKLIVVERYDRLVGPEGSVERVHQEDFCQATGSAPSTKYEEDGGPSLARIAQIVDSVAGRGSLDRLLRAVTLNTIIGNGDAHAKNFSLLHEPSGALTLAPVYDLMSTQYYGDDRLAMYIDNVQRISRVTVERLTNEAMRWGLSGRLARGAINEVIENAPTAIAAARKETPTVPDDLVTRIEEQLNKMKTPV